MEENQEPIYKCTALNVCSFGNADGICSLPTDQCPYKKEMTDHEEKRFKDHNNTNPLKRFLHF